MNDRDTFIELASLSKICYLRTDLYNFVIKLEANNNIKEVNKHMAL